MKTTHRKSNCVKTFGACSHGVTFVFLLLVSVCARGGVPGQIPPATGGQDLISGAIQQVRSGKHARSKAIALLREAIAQNPQHDRAIEAEYYVANLWIGEHCRDPVSTSGFVNEVERIQQAYPKGSRARRTYWYLELQITYSQLVADKMPDVSNKLMWEVAKFDPTRIEVPEKGPWWNNKSAAISRLKIGAVWAVLNDRTRKLRAIPDKAKREEAVMAAANSVLKEMQADKELERCIPYAKWWIRVEVAQEGERVIPPKAIPFGKTGPLIEKASDVWKREGRMLIPATLPATRKAEEHPPPTASAKPKVTYLELGPIHSPEAQKGSYRYLWGGILLTLGLLLTGTGTLLLKRRAKPR